MLIAGLKDMAGSLYNYILFVWDFYNDGKVHLVFYAPDI